MSSNDPGHDGRSVDDFDPDGQFSNLTDGLGSAFRSQADRFEPSNNAYASLAEAVTADQDRRTKAVRNFGWFRPTLAAAAVVATVGVGVALVANQQSQSVDTGPGADESVAISEDGDGSDDETPTASVIEDEADDDATPDQSDTELDDAESAAEDASAGADDLGDAVGSTTPGYGPIRATRQEAADAFLDLLQLDFGAAEVDGDQVVVRSFEEGGVPSADGRIVAELVMAEIGGGFAVAEARTDSVEIGEVIVGDSNDPTVQILGSGTGFEGVLDVDVMSGLDSRSIASSFVQAGSLGELASFTAEIDVAGSEHGWVIVSSSGGASGVLEPFAAQPVSFESAPDPVEYAVIGVTADDPDGGLIVRSGAGTANDEVEVLPAGTGGISRTQDFPVQVGSGTWWSIVTPSGTTGWVNSRFLASNEPLDAEELSAAASGLQFIFVEPGSVSISTRIPIAIGTIDSPITVSGEALQTEAGWIERRSFPMPDEYGEPEQMPLVQFVDAEGWGDVGWEPGGTYTYDVSAAAAETYFADLSSVVFAPENPTGPWRNTHVFFEKTAAGPEVVGIVAEVQRP